MCDAAEPTMYHGQMISMSRLLLGKGDELTDLRLTVDSVN